MLKESEADELDYYNYYYYGIETVMMRQMKE